MEYQELINIWNSSTDELKTNVQLNRTLIKEVAFGKIKSQLYQVKWTAYIGLAVHFFWSVFLVGFIVDNFWESRFSLPALLLLSFSIFGLVLNINNLKLYFSISCRSSVLQTQHKIEKLNYFQLLDIKSLYIIIPLFSAPFAIIMAKAFLNIDLFTFTFLGKVVVYYTLGAALIAMIIVFILRKYPDENLKASAAFLNELKEAEEED